MRDKRFVAVHRGGLLSKEHHRLLINWAHICATHVLSHFGQSIDERLNNALKSAKAWEQGEISVGEARNASLEAIAVANENSNPVSIAVARSVGHAVATAHMADHSVRAADYALKAIKISGQSVEVERKWQDEQLPLDIKDLVLSARDEKPDEKVSIKSKLRN
jgi:biotin carboxylase